MDHRLWKELVTEAVWWRKYDDHTLFELYQRTVSAWGLGLEYYAQGPETVDLTKLFESYRLLATLKGTYQESE